MPSNPPLAPARPRLPVTVLNGFAGAGKTSVLNHLLRHRAAQPTAVIVSDGGCDNGPDEGPAGATTVARTEEKVIRLAVGSGCHALRADLLLAAGRLVREERFGYLLIENPGGAELAPVARTFLLGHAAAGLDLPRRTRLDTLATVVDAGRFWRDFHAPPAQPAGPPDPLEVLEEPAPRCAAEVLTEQVENANVLVLNKTDQARPDELNRLRALLAHLNPRARLVEATFGRVNPTDLLDTSRCDCAAAPAPAPAAAHGISTWRFRDERPFHPARLWEFVREGWPAAVLRSQGLFWLAARPEEVLSWDQAGPSRRAATAGTWWAAVPVAERERDPAFRRDERALRARWHPQFQDRMNTLRFIGQDLDGPRLRADLEGCLCTPLEIGRWRRGSLFDDPWPRD